MLDEAKKIVYEEIEKHRASWIEYCLENDIPIHDDINMRLTADHPYMQAWRAMDELWAAENLLISSGAFGIVKA